MGNSGLVNDSSLLDKQGFVCVREILPTTHDAVKLVLRNRRKVKVLIVHFQVARRLLRFPTERNLQRIEEKIRLVFHEKKLKFIFWRYVHVHVYVFFP